MIGKNMNILYLYLLIWTTTTLCQNVSPRRDLQFLELAKYDGYHAEQHFVTTKDGYILGVFRIPLKASCTKSKGVILYMHGLYLSSDDCLVPGPGIAHCYIYADNCYDVWAPNNRGNLYSRNHTTFDPNKSGKFWDFTFDEFAMYDLPASIDYILSTTGETKLTYVAHSQGVAILVILCSKLPEYNNKIEVGFGLSATAWLQHANFIVIQIQSVLVPLLKYANGLLDVEVFSRNGPIQQITKIICGESHLTYPLCSNILFLMFGYNKYQITSEIFPVVVGHVPSGTSLKNFIRWGQTKNGFTEYDYGMVKNSLVYGEPNPPLYNLSNVNMKWVMISSHNDNVGDLRDVEILVSHLPNAESCVVSEKTFAHLDFIFGKDIPKYITPTILTYIENGTLKCF